MLVKLLYNSQNDLLKVFSKISQIQLLSSMNLECASRIRKRERQKNKGYLKERLTIIEENENK